MTNLASREELITWRTLRSSHAQLCALRYPDKFCRPYEHRKQQRRAVRFAAEQAFEAVFNQWVEFRRLSLKEGRQNTLSQILRIFNKDVLPTLGGRSIYDINRHDLLDLLSRIEQRKALTTAEKCRAWLNQLFRYALVKIEHRLEMSTLLGAVQ